MPTPAIKTQSRLRSYSQKKSAGWAICLTALSAVLLALPLAMSHHLITAALNDTSFGQYLSSLGLRGAATGPKLMLWSWQHNDNLSHLDPTSTGVSILAGRLTVKNGSIVFDRNMCTVQLPPGVYREAAVRLDIKAPGLSNDQSGGIDLAEKLSSKIVEVALVGSRRISSVLIDFDARSSERGFYTLLLRKVRAKLPASVKLNMTALASWCVGDNWISPAHLPVDQVVPMLFSMGYGRAQIYQCLRKDSTLSSKSMAGRLAPGLSLQEPEAFELLGRRLTKYEHLYLFSSRGWNQYNYNRALLLLQNNGFTVRKISHKQNQVKTR